MPIPLIVDNRVFYEILDTVFVFHIINLLSEDETVAKIE